MSLDDRSPPFRDQLPLLACYWSLGSSCAPFRIGSLFVGFLDGGFEQV
jgi:hypothetical protein